MTTEIREFGDNKTVVVFTDEQEVAQKLRERKQCLNIVAYEQDTKKRVTLVGWDFYFPKRQLRGLLKSTGGVIS